MKKKCLKQLVDIYAPMIAEEYMNVDGHINDIGEMDIYCNNKCSDCKASSFCETLSYAGGIFGYQGAYKKVSGYLIKKVSKEIERVKYE